MSVEQIIDQLRIARSDNSLSEEVYSKTVAALRAGQAMRNCFNPIAVVDGSFWASDIRRSDIGVAGLAWDAATREEV